MLELLNVISTGSINVGVLVGIIGLLLLIKKFDSKKILGGGFYLIAVVILGLIVGTLLSKDGIKEAIISGLAHAGVASLIYQYGEKLLPTKRKWNRESDRFVVFRRNK